MKKLLLLTLFAATIFCGCKTPTLEPGGAYAQTNALGQVVYNEIGLALADASYKLAYETIQTVMKFERDNRDAIWKISPQVKTQLDILRPQVVAVDLRWATARQSYRLNPTPTGLSTIQTVLDEVQRFIPVVQSQLQSATIALTSQPK